MRGDGGSRLPRFGEILAWVALVLAVPSAPVGAQLGSCDEDCFAVFIMPDTQVYVSAHPFGVGVQGTLGVDQKRAHLRGVADWICDNRIAWAEPEGGPSMQVELLVHLGDLVQRNDTNGIHPNDPSCSEPHQDNFCEWSAIDQVFDILDACPGGPLRYLTVPGNHDWDGVNDDPQPGFATTDAYEQWFGETARPGSAWADRCTGLSVATDCVGSEWYLGGGGDVFPEDPVGDCDASNDLEPIGNHIGANTRGNATCDVSDPGLFPATDQKGRHRAGVVRSPDSQSPFLFLGMEHSAGLDYSRPWPGLLMEQNPGVPTLLFNHEGLSAETVDELLVPNTQVLATLNGHTGSGVSVDAYPGLEAGGNPYQVPKVTRNFQWHFNGFGCNVMAVVDPTAREVRLHTICIDGTYNPTSGEYEGMAESHDYQRLVTSGQTVEDQEYTIHIPDLLPRDLDNCPNDPNPDQLDTDGDGVGDACDSCISAPNPGSGQTDDQDGDGFPDACDVCPDLASTDQTDTDGNGVGDECNFWEDPDGDEFGGVDDNCPLVWNDSQADSDGDGAGDACDKCAGGPETCSFPDADGDNWPNDGLDNCPGVWNPYQWDADRDGIGDACDTDDDNDTILDGADTCRLTPDAANEDSDSDGWGDVCDNCVDAPNAEQLDSDMNGIGNACDCDFDNDGPCVNNDEVLLNLAIVQGVPRILGDPRLDMTGDGLISGPDYVAYTAAAPDPGPSGLDCAGIAPCLARERMVGAAGAPTMFVSIHMTTPKLPLAPSWGAAPEVRVNGPALWWKPGNVICQFRCDCPAGGSCGSADWFHTDLPRNVPEDTVMTPPAGVCDSIYASGDHAYDPKGQCWVGVGPGASEGLPVFTDPVPTATLSVDPDPTTGPFTLTCTVDDDPDEGPLEYIGIFDGAYVEIVGQDLTGSGQTSATLQHTVDPAPPPGTYSYYCAGQDDYSQYDIDVDTVTVEP